MSRLTREEFENRFLGDEIDLSPREVVREESGWVIELDRMPYEKTALKLKTIVERSVGDKPVYLQVGTTTVKLGDIKPNIGILNDMYQTLTTLGVRITEDGEDVKKESYLSDAKLPELTESDYLV